MSYRGQIPPAYSGYGGRGEENGGVHNPYFRKDAQNAQILTSFNQDKSWHLDGFSSSSCGLNCIFYFFVDQNLKVLMEKQFLPFIYIFY